MSPSSPFERLATLGVRYSGSCPDRLAGAFVRKLEVTSAFQTLEKLPPLPRFQASVGPLPIQQLAHCSGELHPAQPDAALDHILTQAQLRPIGIAYHCFLRSTAHEGVVVWQDH